ncbi:MAG TPA: DUF892 family protein [Steroidobacteraceae bacterium]|nr:DUF892 family protein [Steroidobacteraceae bacterium]
MPSLHRPSILSQLLSAPPGNLSAYERWLSLVAGLGLTSAALTRGGFVRRLGLAAAGLTLVTRGTTGFCGTKAALAGEYSLRAGLREQWQRTRAQLGGSAGGISSLHDLYIEELQELADGAGALHRLLGELGRVISHADVASKLSGYATELASRAQDLRRMLAGSVGDASHPDQALAAMINESRKMMHVLGENVRDAALIDSVQRLLHYEIAASGSVAAYAKALGRPEVASRLAEFADRDKALDAALSELAMQLVNRQAAGASATAAEARTH